MKKAEKGLIAILCSVVALVGFTIYNMAGTTWYTVDLPLILSYEPYAYMGFEVPKEIEVLDIKLKQDSIVGMAAIENQGSNRYMVRYNDLDPNMKFKVEYTVEGSELSDIVSSMDEFKALDNNAFNYYGMPVSIQHVDVEIKTHKGHKKALEQWAMHNDKSQALRVAWQEPFYGKTAMEEDVFESADILEEKLKLSEKKVNAQISDAKERFLGEYPEFELFVKNLVEEQDQTEEKVRKVFKWIDDNIEYIETAGEKEENERLLNINYIWTEKKGNCRSKAYLAKAMLETLGIESKGVMTFIAGKDGRYGAHMSLKCYMEQDSTWKNFTFNPSEVQVKSIDDMNTLFELTQKSI